jgi:pyruvate dehydrogenase E1 component
VNNFDLDPQETNDWLAALQSLNQADGIERVNFIVQRILHEAQKYGCNINVSSGLNTLYKNTIELSEQPPYPGDLVLERKIIAIIRWNAAIMVVKAGRTELDLGGHIGSFASSAVLYDVGFNHFWRAASPTSLGDLIFYQGHISPGIYARSLLEGRISLDQLLNFRQEVAGKGVSSYPHPWLMPSYWQFPTVSMGLGPLQAIYQARYMKYLEARGLIAPSSRKIWCFCGDGEMDEPESLGALGVASRENLDNLIFVINCNLQRLDGPVRGNSKIIQELESYFLGAKWQVLKVIWAGDWDELLAHPHAAKLLQRMDEAVDGDYQAYKGQDAAYVREHFFGKYPELREMVAQMSDDDIWKLERGGHDHQKVYAAYHKAVNTVGKPTVILAKTVKGYGLGTAGEAQNTAHNAKKMTEQQLTDFVKRFDIPIAPEEIAALPFYTPAPDSPEMQYLHQQRAKLNGYLPARREKTDKSYSIPALSDFAGQFEGTGEREISTTMAFVRIITQLTKDKNIGKLIVPIIPDEARTFGMEGLFRQIGIYSSQGQLYTPVDKAQVMYYKESTDGQMLQEGINEAGAFCSWLAAATSYSTHNQPTIPFYIYYSMFGFQRIGDLAWAAGDSRARGFLLGATAGRTTLNGEGLQHEDGHSHVMAALIPNCINYDPVFNYELAVIIQDGLRRMFAEQEDVFYYITVMNENYVHPPMPVGAEAGIIKGLYKFAQTTNFALQVNLLSSGTIFNEAVAAAKILEEQFAISATIWSATSFTLLGREAADCARYNRLHPSLAPKVSYVASCLNATDAPVIAVTDYIKAYPDSIREYIKAPYIVLGTDGYGRSDSRAQLRHFFEVNRYYIVIAALNGLLEQGKIQAQIVADAIDKFNIDVNKVNPLYA